MKITRRLAVIAALAVAPMLAQAVPASAAWVCASVDRLDLTACVRNPIPSQPPVDLPDSPL